VANKSSVVLDASALLAALYMEPGVERVHEVLDDSVLSTVNLAEVAGKLRMEAGWTKAEVAVGLDLPLEIVEFNADMAKLAGELLPQTRTFGLSLGIEPACLRHYTSASKPFLRQIPRGADWVGSSPMWWLFADPAANWVCASLTEAMTA
jgi:PIN domain nuclease of toxin-antitoxin system